MKRKRSLKHDDWYFIFPKHLYLVSMPFPKIFTSLILIVLFAACKPGKKEEVAALFLPATETVLLNQVVYKSNAKEAFAKYAPGYEVVFVPEAVNGNYAIIAKRKEAEQYALIIRGSVMEFSNEGFQNFILQDFNIFKIKAWPYTDTVKEAYVSLGAYSGFQNLLQLKDIATGLTIREFIGQKIPAGASIVVTGHSLGGNLAYPFAGYLKKELPAGKKNLQLITFGAPAAGNAAFIKDMEGKFPDAERYAASMDIAVVFPDVKQIGELAKITGLDSVLQLNQLNIKGLDAGNLLNMAGELLRKTDVINEANEYVQSKKHLRVLTSKEDTLLQTTVLSAEAIFARAYLFHKIDAYAVLLGGKPLNE